MSDGITRREVLKAALASPIVAAAATFSRSQNVTSDRLAQWYVSRSPAKVVSEDGAPAPKHVRLRRRWQGKVCQSQLTNYGSKSIRVKEVILFDYSFSLPVGTITLTNARMICCFNWGDEDRSFRFKLPGLGDVTDYWTGEKFREREGWFAVNDVSPHTAVMLKVT